MSIDQSASASERGGRERESARAHQQRAKPAPHFAPFASLDTCQFQTPCTPALHIVSTGRSSANAPHDRGDLVVDPSQSTAGMLPVLRRVRHPVPGYSHLLRQHSSGHASC
eukprot:3760106-Rhodomonas_salina.1